MRNSILTLSLIFVFFNLDFKLSAQDYNEESVRQQLDKFIENPKLYFDKIKSLNEKAEKANQNTLKVSEEYLSLLDKKDSLLKIYKNQASRAQSMPATGSPTSSTVAAKPAANPQTTVGTKPAPAKSELTPYRVQLAAFFRDDFSKFFGTFNKTIGIQRLDNRNVIEVQGFRDSIEAMEFSQKIRKLGFPGAFVSKYDESGNRQEGYAATGTRFGLSGSSAGSSMNSSVQYPNYVPIAYQEMTGRREAATINSAPVRPATPAELKSTPTPSNAAPTSIPINKKTVTAAATTPVKPASIAPSTPPKTLANASVPPTAVKSTPSNPSSPSNASAPKVNKDTRDQLDAAFDQLFKR